MDGDDKVAEFAWRNLRDTLLYTAGLVPEIADSIEEIDNAMKWGFNWELVITSYSIHYTKLYDVVDRTTLEHTPRPKESELQVLQPVCHCEAQLTVGIVHRVEDVVGGKHGLTHAVGAQGRKLRPSVPAVRPLRGAAPCVVGADVELVV